MRPDPLAAPLAAVIADDLTGALDSVVPFADAGLRCVVATAPAHLAQALGQGAQVIAVSTGSRDLPAGQAALGGKIRMQSFVADHCGLKKNSCRKPDSTNGSCSSSVAS